MNSNKKICDTGFYLFSKWYKFFYIKDYKEYFITLDVLWGSLIKNI